MKKLIHSKPKTLIKCKALLAEGPVWNHRTKEFSFVDILNQNIFIYKNKKRIRKFKSKQMISNFLPSKNNSWISCGKNKVFQIKIKKNKIFCKKLISIKHKKNNRFNDASIDSQGRLWASTMDENEISKSGNLFFFPKINSPKKLLGNFIIGNGIDWSPCKKKLYFVASDKRKIYIFDYERKAGKISKRKIFARIPYQKGKPDGLCVDSMGFVWVACWDGSCIIRFKINGKIDKIIKLPISRPTSVCFGGKNLNTLFITSARKTNKFNQPEKDSGNIFFIKTNVKGIETNFFK